MTATSWPSLLPSTQLGDESRGPSPLWKTAPKADPELAVNEQALKRTIDYLTVDATAEEGRRNWSVALRLLLAWLPGLSFAEAARIVGIPAPNLVKILHGDLRLQPSTHDRIRRLLNLVVDLQALLDPADIGPWFKTPVPALNGESPLEAARKGRIAHLERVVSSYFDASYS